MRSCSSALAALWLMLASAPVVAQADVSIQLEETDTRPALALMGTIPIYWGEMANLDEFLSGEVRPHWARAVIERSARPVPVDYLSSEALAPFDMLLMAQPRGLTGEENVALDAWVRAGGRLLLFADPTMTGESRFGIGDRRRPQDTILLSPILARWGLQLTADAFEADAGHGHDAIEYADHEGQRLPFSEAGRFVALAEGDCETSFQGLLARCAIGEGEVLLMADAAILDVAGPHPGAEAGFAHLLFTIFPQFGENAGLHPAWNDQKADSQGITPCSNSPDTDRVTISELCQSQ